MNHSLAMPTSAAPAGDAVTVNGARTTDYDLIAAAIGYLDAHYVDQPGLDDLAAFLHLSPFHTQRLFTRWAGISPKRFLQYLTIEHAKQALAASANVLDASLNSGLSGPGRLHDLFVTVEAVTPGEYKSGGEGLQITWGVHESPFGDCLLAVTERGVCGLSFIADSDSGMEASGASGTVANLQARWPSARLTEDRTATLPWMDTIFRSTLDNTGVPDTRPIQLLLKGTNFQIRVWEALLRIPSGAVTTYEGVARAIGEPAASRAVGSALGSNAIGWLIPCHRVIRKSGVVEGYHWGSVRKKAMLAWEAGRAEGA